MPKSKTRRLPSRLWLVIGILLTLIIAGMIIARQAYANGLKPVSGNQQTQIVTVEKGSSVKAIAAELEEYKLIRSAWAFQLYVHRKNLNDQLKAGTYALSPSQGTAAIVNTLTKGEVATRLVTIFPGRRIDQVRADLINVGFTPEAVDQALNPDLYKDLPALAYKPSDAPSLEGLLWPDSYQKQPDTDPSVIIRQSLVAMGEHLTPEIQAAFAAQGLTTYQGLILASLVHQEVSKPSDQAQVAQVFLSRLKAGTRLGADVSTKYGSIIAIGTPSLEYDSPYNTHLHSGLPPSPISTINVAALQAAAQPASTNWWYFVSGDDGTTHFSHTIEEHEAATERYCHELCGN